MRLISLKSSRLQSNLYIPVKRRVVFVLGAMTAVLLVSLIFILFAKVPQAFSVVVPTESEDLELIFFELNEGKVVVITIPKDTQMNLAMNRGTLRVKSVRRLIDSEKLPGRLLSDTVMKTLYLPVDYWAGRQHYGTFWGGDMPLPVRLTIFLQNIRGLKEERVDLADTTVLTKERLKDGEDGYVVSGRLPLTLISLFAEPAISSSQTAVRLVNGTGEPEYVLTDVASILEVLGAKPVPPLTVDAVDVDCLVRANDEYSRERIASVFDCSVSKETPEAFDIELLVGSRFVERF